jgi:hypothetical protein
VCATPALADVQSWDGTNPFSCTMQDGAAPKDPGADPFCAEYTRSAPSADQLTALVTDGPNQLAAASSKCFVYQVDHWRGPAGAYSWDDALFFNKATGAGGIFIANLTLAGIPVAVPGVPPQLAPFFGTGGGGAMISGDVPIDQNCSVGAGNAPGGGGSPGAGSGGGLPTGLGRPNPGTKPRAGTSCKNLSGNTNNGVGKAHLGLKRRSVSHRLGKPTRRAHGFYHYCLRKGGDLAVHFGRGGRSDVVIASGKSFHAGKVKIGSRLTRVRSALHHEQVLGHSKRDWVIGVTHRHWRLLVGLSKNRVVYIAAVARRLSIPTLAKVLTNASR